MAERPDNPGTPGVPDTEPTPPAKTKLRDEFGLDPEDEDLEVESDANQAAQAEQAAHAAQAEQAAHAEQAEQAEQATPEPPPDPLPSNTSGQALEKEGSVGDIGEFAARIGASDRFRSHGDGASQWWEYEYQIPGYLSEWYSVNPTHDGGIEMSVRLPATVGDRELENFSRLRIDQYTSPDEIDSGVTAHIGDTQDRLYIYEALGKRVDLADALTIDSDSGRIVARFQFGARMFTFVPDTSDAFTIEHYGTIVLSSVPADISRRDIEEAIVRVWKNEWGPKPEPGKVKESIYRRTEDALPAVGQLVFFRTPSGVETGRVADVGESAIRVVTATGEMNVGLAQIFEDSPFAEFGPGAEPAAIDRFVQREKGLGDVWDMDEEQFIAVYGKRVEKYDDGIAKRGWRMVDPYSGETTTSAVGIVRRETYKEQMLRKLFEKGAKARDLSRQMRETLESRGFSKDILKRMERRPTGTHSCLAYKGPGGDPFEVFIHEKTGQIRLAALEIGLPIRPNDDPDTIDRYISIIHVSSNREEFPDGSQYAASGRITKLSGENFGGEADGGIYIDLSGGIYEGPFHNGLGRFGGKSSYRYADGRRYEGGMIKNYFGRGEFSDTKGNKFSGEFDHGEPYLVHRGGNIPHAAYADGSIYDGAVSAVKAPQGGIQTFFRHGQGRYATRDAIFDGNFVYDELPEGSITFSDGRMYQGVMYKWTAEGKGVEYFPVSPDPSGTQPADAVGSVYQGDFHDGRRHGIGFYRWQDGGTYYGEWANGVQHGKGIQRSPDGREQAGTWENGKFLAAGAAEFRSSLRGFYDADRERFFLFDGQVISMNIPELGMPCVFATEKENNEFHDFKLSYGGGYELLGSYVKGAGTTDLEARFVRIRGELRHIETGVGGAGGMAHALQEFARLVKEDDARRKGGASDRLPRAEKPWGRGDRPKEIADVANKDIPGTRMAYDGEWDTNADTFHGGGTLRFQGGTELVAIFDQGKLVPQRAIIRRRIIGSTVYDEYDGDTKAGIEQGNGAIRMVEEKENPDTKQKEIVKRLVFRGQFADGKKQGMGVAYGGHEFLEARYANDVAEEGLYHYANGAVYRGKFLDGKPHGRGTLLYSNGGRYIGMFEQGLPHDADGVLLSASGDVLRRGKWEQGAFVLDAAKSQKIEKLPDGSSYEGEVNAAGVPHGYGKKTREDRVTYTGNFYNGFYHGRGVIATPLGARWECEWEGGLPTGIGSFTEVNGDVYVGEFAAVNGTFAPEGKGMWRYRDGRVFDGVFDKGKKTHGKEYEGGSAGMHENRLIREGHWEGNRNFLGMMKVDNEKAQEAIKILSSRKDRESIVTVADDRASFSIPDAMLIDLGIDTDAAHAMIRSVEQSFRMAMLREGIPAEKAECACSSIDCWIDFSGTPLAKDPEAQRRIFDTCMDAAGALVMAEGASMVASPKAKETKEEREKHAVRFTREELRAMTGSEPWKKALAFLGFGTADADQRAGKVLAGMFADIFTPGHVEHAIRAEAEAITGKTWGDIKNELKSGKTYKEAAGGDENIRQLAAYARDGFGIDNLDEAEGMIGIASDMNAGALSKLVEKKKKKFEEIVGKSGYTAGEFLDAWGRELGKEALEGFKAWADRVWLKQAALALEESEELREAESLYTRTKAAVLPTNKLKISAPMASAATFGLASLAHFLFPGSGFAVNLIAGVSAGAVGHGVRYGKKREVVLKDISNKIGKLKKEIVRSEGTGRRVQDDLAHILPEHVLTFANHVIFEATHAKVQGHGHEEGEHDTFTGLRMYAEGMKAIAHEKRPKEAVAGPLTEEQVAKGEHDLDAALARLALGTGQKHANKSHEKGHGGGHGHGAPKDRSVDREKKLLEKKKTETGDRERFKSLAKSVGVGAAVSWLLGVDVEWARALGYTTLGTALGVEEASRRVDPKAVKERKKDVFTIVKQELTDSWDILKAAQAKKNPTPEDHKKIRARYAELLGYVKSGVLSARPDLYGAINSMLSQLAPYMVEGAESELRDHPLEEVIARVSSLAGEAEKKSEEVKKILKKHSAKDSAKIVGGAVAGFAVGAAGEVGVHAAEELWNEYLSWLTAEFPLKGRNFRAPNPTVKF